MSANTAEHADLRWPPDRFYWAELDAMGWSGAGVLPPGLLLSLADELPVPLESVHAVAAPIDRGRVVVCACSRELLSSIEPRAVSLVPETTPEAIQGRVDPARLNLLVGPFEPAPIRAFRRTRHLHLAITCLICSVLIGMGAARRSLRDHTVSVQSGAAADALLAQATTDRREQSLAAEVRTMRAIADAARRAKPPSDASASLERLLKVWPTEVPSKPQSVSVASDGISIGVVVEGDPAPFLKALRAPAGFALDEPRVTTAGPVTRLSLHLRASGGTP